MKSLFLASPPETYAPHKDTTKVLMEEGAARGLEIWTAEHTDLEAEGGQVRARARRLEFPAGDDGAWFAVAASERVDLRDFAVVWFREDPPFDDRYLHTTQLADLADGPVFINEPTGLRAANEKLLTLGYPELIPPTLMTSDPEAILGFIDHVGGEGVVKPIDGFGGTGIFRATLDDPNLGSILQTVTQHGTSWTIVQRYMPEIEQGDMRILLMDGESIGAFMRVPRPGEFRGNMMQGGAVHTVELGVRERAIIDAVRPDLERLGLRLVGLDVIGGRLTEINVTSPTGFQEVRKLTGNRPEAIAWERALETAR